MNGKTQLAAVVIQTMADAQVGTVSVSSRIGCINPLRQVGCINLHVGVKQGGRHANPLQCAQPTLSRCFRALPRSAAGRGKSQGGAL